MKWGSVSLSARFNAWLLRVGKGRVVLAITTVSVVLSVLMTWVGNLVFMPHVPWEEWLYISFIVPAIISPGVSYLVLSLLYQLEDAKRALVTMSETDPLTGVGNRRHFLAQAHVAFTQAAQTGAPLCVVLIDIDHFKQLNDSHGHAVGDKALIMVAEVCRQNLRAGDAFCRWGGEEFIALLPTSTLEQGCQLADRLRVSVADRAQRELPVALTISLGVAELHHGSESIEVLIGRADEQLYRAKAAGRNRVAP